MLSKVSLVLISISILILASCSNRFEASNEIAFLIESQCEEEVVAYFQGLEKIQTFRTKIVATPRHSLFNSIKQIGIIQTSLDDVDLEAYAYGAKNECGSKRTGLFTKNGAVSLDPHVYSLSGELSKTIYVEIEGDNARIYQ